ncbi:hypothetical protein ACWCP8_32800 [Streptomyces sp. NPDC002206]
MKLSHVPAYGLDSVAMNAGVSRLGPGPHRDVSWDGLGAWTGLTSLCVRTLALPVDLFAVLRRTPAVTALRPAEPALYGLAAETALPDVRPSPSSGAHPRRPARSGLREVLKVQAGSERPGGAAGEAGSCPVGVVGLQAEGPESDGPWSHCG